MIAWEWLEYLNDWVEVVRVLAVVERRGQGSWRSGWEWLECLPEWVGVVRMFARGGGNG